MVNYYDELEIEDFAWDPVARVFHYPCPCGDRFEISKAQLRDGEEIATCPSCSLIVRVIYDYLDWEDYATTDEEDDNEDEEHASFDGGDDQVVTSAPTVITDGAEKNVSGELGKEERDEKGDHQSPEVAVPASKGTEEKRRSGQADDRLEDKLGELKLNEQ